MTFNEIPQETIRRLPMYLRKVYELLDKDQSQVSSEQLARELPVNSPQVRKDLSYFGDFGTRGVGYDVQNLAREIRSILHLDRTWPMALVGVGNIGSALLTYPGFEKKGFTIEMAFDQAPEIIGQTIGQITIEDVANLETRLRQEDIPIGIIAVPSPAAQNIADCLVEAGIEGIVNFAPTILQVPEEVHVNQVDITIEFCELVYYL